MWRSQLFLIEFSIYKVKIRTVELAQMDELQLFDKTTIHGSSEPYEDSVLEYDVHLLYVNEE